MKENFEILRKKFNEIKNVGFIEPLRKGSTGIGYTFESLLNKKEDSICNPDYNGIELKTKFGYSKSPMTLFNCVPKRNNESAINYILESYSWQKYNDINVFIFSNEVYSKKSIKKYNYSYKLYVDYLGKKVVMKSYYKNCFKEDICYWDFKELEKKLKIKLKYLAIIHAYPYRIKNKLYYKYLKMNTYKLKNFFEFLKLIEEDKIQVKFYIKRNADNFIDNHGVSFRINNDYIEELFTKLPY